MINQDKTLHSEAPKDHHKLVYLAFYFTGLNILFPYVMIINVTDFWNFKFRNTSLPFENTDTSLTTYQKQLPSLLSLSSNVPIIFFVLLTILLGWRTR